MDGLSSGKSAGNGTKKLERDDRNLKETERTTREGEERKETP